MTGQRSSRRPRVTSATPPSAETRSADLTAPAGRYSYYLFDYKGPTINPIGTPINQLLPTRQVIQQIFDWFKSVGGTTNSDLLSDISIPGYTTRFDHSLSSVPHQCL